MPHRALVAHVDVGHLGVHGVVHRSVRVADVVHEDLKNALSFGDCLDHHDLVDETREVGRLIVVGGGRCRPGDVSVIDVQLVDCAWLVDREGMECQSRWSGVASGVGIFCFFLLPVSCGSGGEKRR